MIHTGTTGPVTASNTSSETDVSTSSISQQSEATHRLDDDTSNTCRPGDSSQSDSLVTDSVMSQERASLASAALPSSPVTSIPNPDDKQPTVSSHLEPTVSEMSSSSSMPYQQKDHQPQPTLSNPESKQTMQHPQSTTPNIQMQEHYNSDADGKSGIEKSVTTPQQPVEQQQQSDQGRCNNTQQKLPQQRQGQEYVVRQMSLDKQKQVVWSGIMEIKEGYNPVSSSIIRFISVH